MMQKGDAFLLNSAVSERKPVSCDHHTERAKSTKGRGHSCTSGKIKLEKKPEVGLD